MVYELPGGSALKPGVNPLMNAQHELEEETGIKIEDVNRFEFFKTKQLCSILSSHCSHLYKVELNKDEFEKIKKYINESKTFGVIEDTEIIYLEIISVSNVMNYPIDYSMIGIILGALLN